MTEIVIEHSLGEHLDDAGQADDRAVDLMPQSDVLGAAHRGSRRRCVKCARAEGPGLSPLHVLRPDPHPAVDIRSPSHTMRRPGPAVFGVVGWCRSPL